MPDYIYLLENRLSAEQQHALRTVREATREAGMILFLTGDAVRDLTSGHAVHELEVSVHGNALKLKKIIEKLGATIWGESEASRTLYLCFPGTVRVDIVSTHRVEYPKPGSPVYHPASIQEDLRRRDFTVNGMAISLNEGSFGLLMDPLNGVADIEARTLRLISNYGFLEEPSLLIRATRYSARLGWELDPKTKTRYDNAREEGVIELLSAEARSRELEEIAHEEDGLKVLRALEDEGWMKVLYPAWTAAKADEEKLKGLHDLAVELLVQGVRADVSAAQIQLLTAKMSAKEIAALKKLMLRPGFAEEWSNLDAQAAGFAKALLSKANATPSATFKLFTSYDPEAILWLGFTSTDTAVKERYNQFLKTWPEVRQRIPHALMQEMRITPELAAYHEIVHAIFLELIDGRLTTPEEMRAFLEPHSPPAPPPQVTIKRPRAKRGEAKVKEASYDDDEDSDDALDGDDDLDDIGGGDDDMDLGLPIPKRDLDSDLSDEAEPAEDEVEDDGEHEPAPVETKRAAKKSARPEPAEKAQKPEPVVPPKPEPKVALKAVPAPPAAKTKPVPEVKKAAPAPVVDKASKPTKSVSAPAKAPAKIPAMPASKPSVKVAAKPAAKAPVKAAAAKSAPAKSVPAKSAPAKGKQTPAAASKAVKPSQAAKPSKPVAKKAAAKPAKKR